MEIDFYMNDGVFIKQVVLPMEGDAVKQHSHKYAHTTMIARGMLRVWVDGKFLGDFKAPYGLDIPAETNHHFLALEPNTIFYCIHNTHNFPADQINDLLVSEGTK